MRFLLVLVLVTVGVGFWVWLEANALLPWFIVGCLLIVVGVWVLLSL
jgi:hypothetical protein